ncbi:ABC transporter ATP-binding protein [Bradyrhizobium sp. U87765 SZCCT0131]|uniref:ABC transporter ATP-binding protein n=1 Tax=unclassified Bradyrhizobium TaxID=2631580 RepID=UPI001BA73D61|nr:MULTISPECIES: ABC transporter ATP-binding protein [unclassified Bradyrhizobium]MBR1222174.1 ABC transporter ATP-binding protein [Bradyrhizobium sp. U87765 SZCCT0131]MBR1265697.1 ABC transporter ATP-binding protein [Bradyrhizobium sp. U87765 SZCCT0134]MBR1307875.1 ABC transporter ATP-binding protein [Bradyrhizobium sp. U87765 SZCCT0110]MBR1324015.1 ABC transporter ATP-binding protein [Bradyrhizobium sp. U87765 SZCCT0109]MBR1348295.1 ABC transporter ATP-binding protein [Bradyrhizobium sp. U87
MSATHAAPPPPQQPDPSGSQEATHAAAQGATKIHVAGLGKVYAGHGKGAGVQALRDVVVDIRTGEFCCIVGPSGCGKTTLLRILAGLERHTSGVAQVRQDDPQAPLDSMVFQDQSVFPWMTVEDNVAYGLRRRGAAAAVMRERTDYYIAKVGLAAFRTAYPHQLSGGMKQRVSIARAFANDPEVLLMDEPFAALDEQNKALLQEELLKIWEETRKTVLFITHSIDEAIALSDRTLVMTARPGTIKSDIRNTLPRPRDPHGMKAHPAYAEMSRRIWTELRDEVVMHARRQQEAS